MPFQVARHELLSELEPGELRRRIDEARARMRPVEAELAALRAERDLLLTEQKRRERESSRGRRADARKAIQQGELVTIGELVAGATGAFEDFAFHLKTGGLVRLGYPGARAQSLAFTDGVSTAQAEDLARASELYAAGWELGTPGRPGVRVHFPGTRQEKVIQADDVYARAAEAVGG